MTKYDDLVKRLREPVGAMRPTISDGCEAAATTLRPVSEVQAETHAAAIEACAENVWHECYPSTNQENISEIQLAEAATAELAIRAIRALHTDASRACLAEREERIKREAREEALREAAELVRPKNKPKQLHTRFVARPEPRSQAVFEARNSLSEAIITLIKKDHPHD